MNELSSLTEAFKHLEHGDDITIRTENGTTYANTIIDPGAITHHPLNIVYIIGTVENDTHLAHDNNQVQVKQTTERGLEPNGETVIELTNHTKNERATQN